MSSQLADSPLKMLREELKSALQRAQNSLATYLEDTDEAEALAPVADSVEQIRGVFVMLGRDDAADLLEEMGAVARELSNEAIAEEDRARESLLDSLLQLSQYLEWLQRGEQGGNFNLLPLTNELRTVRGLSPKSSSEEIVENRPSSAADPDQLAESLRPEFLRYLLNVFRGAELDSSIAGMSDIFAQLRDSMRDENAYYFWWLAGVFASDLRQSQHEVSRDSKMLLRDVDSQMKRLLEFGEPAFDGLEEQEVCIALKNYLMASDGGREALELRAGYKPPVSSAPAGVGFGKGQIAPPDSDTLEQIAKLLGDTLSIVKDSVDRFATGDERKAARLEGQLDNLHHIAVVLNLLEMDLPADLIQEQQITIAGRIEAEGKISDDEIFQLARSLILVEDSLTGVVDAAFSRRRRSSDQIKGDAKGGLLTGYENRQARGLVGEQALHIMRRAREEATTQFGDTQEQAQWDSLADNMHELGNILNMLEGGRAQGLLNRLEGTMRSQASSGQLDSDVQVKSFAETMVALEFYLERLRDGASADDASLDYAEDQLSLLEQVVGMPEPKAGYVAAHDETTGDDTQTLDIGDIAAAAGATATLSFDEEETTIGESPEMFDEISLELSPDGATIEVEAFETSAPKTVPDTEIDPEFLEIFLEEATEVLEEMDGQLAAWRHNSADGAALADIRRGFHTLKGSGRMVGLTEVGEFAWDFESLLNRVIDGSIAPGTAVIGAVAEARDALVPVVTPEAAGHGDKALFATLSERAKTLAKGEEVDPGQAVVVSTPAAGAEALIGELAGHPALAEPQSPYEKPLADILKGVQQVEEGNDAIPDLIEALHQLQDVAEPGKVSRSVWDITESLEQYLLALQGRSQFLEGEGMALFKQGADHLKSMLLGKSVPSGGVGTVLNNLARLSIDLSEPLPEAPAGAIETVSGPVGEIDPELLQIFMQEANEILDASDMTLESWRTNPKDATLLNDLRRGMHTLKGGARMCGISAAGDLAHGTESVLDAIAMDRIEAGSDAIECVQQSLDRVHGMVSRLRDGQTVEQAEDLLTRIEGVLKGESVSALAPTTQTTSPIMDSVPLVDDPEEDIDELDSELVEIFLEEAVDILDTSDATLKRWSVDLQNTAELNDLRRAMHTLKGGARMTGFSKFGSLAHGMESLLDGVASGKLKGNTEIVGVLQRTLDRFNDMLSRIRSGQDSPPSKDLLDTFAALVKGESAPQPIFSATQTALDVEEASLGETAQAALGSAVAGADAGGAATQTVRVSSKLLDTLVNQMGESSIFRARIDQGVGDIRFNLTEMDQTIFRLQTQLRRLEIETEAQILFRYEEGSEEDQEFDPLELDRFSELQQLSRSLMEVVDDLSSIKNSLENNSVDIGGLLDQQGKINKDIQEGLMRTRLVRFDTVIPRLGRVVRQACRDLGKKAELVVMGGEAEIERNVLERLVAALEHVLRNAVSHGVEMPDARKAAGKPETGTISLVMRREGSEFVLQVNDDGGGLNYEKILAKAVSLGLVKHSQKASEDFLASLMLRPGFSTAEKVTQVSGRGVGLDVLDSAIKAMRGALQIRSRTGRGVSFIVRLPYSLAVTEALLVSAGGQTYAMPLLGVEAVSRVSEADLKQYLSGEHVEHQYGDYSYPLRSLGVLFGGGAQTHEHEYENHQAPVLLVRSADSGAALQVDSVIGKQEIIVKPVSPQIHSVPGISGATVLGDGSVVMVLEPAALLRNLDSQTQLAAEAATLNKVQRHDQEPAVLSVLVVDDSVTMRKVTSRFLQRHGMITDTAKDGLDAVGKLAESTPDLIILDIEMPRMDGFELAAHVRKQDDIKDIPIIMVTSRTGEKHRDRAIRLGVNEYLGKPYQEDEMIEAIRSVLGDRAEIYL